MADTFLHGVETIQVASVSGTVSTVKTAVIALIGTASEGDVDTLKLCVSEGDDEQWGDTGTIVDALKIIRNQLKKAIVFVVSVGSEDDAPTSDSFVGSVDSDTGARTGLKLFDTCRAKYGYVPKIFIAPVYSSTTAIATALRSYAATYRGGAYLDSPVGMTIANALLTRTGIWNFSDYRAKLLYPGILDDDGAVMPFSAYAAGLRAKIDVNEGFWYSSSSHALTGVTGSETEIQFELTDDSSQANQLNAIGITTVVNMYASGLMEWGNRNSAFPSNEDTRTFEAMQRLDDITSESIEYAMVTNKFLDKPMNKAQIDLVTNTVQNYFNTLISRGALLPGSKVYFDESKNTTTEMAKGHYVWTKDFMGAVPGERFTFYSVIDTDLLTSLLS
jgi:phage tail sheath protein FI